MNSKGRGRPKNPVWKCFVRLDSGETKHPSARCNYCNIDINTAQSHRLGRHIFECELAPYKEKKDEVLLL
jgi:hypothetical protein